MSNHQTERSLVLQSAILKHLAVDQLQGRLRTPRPALLASLALDGAAYEWDEFVLALRELDANGFVRPALGAVSITDRALQGILREGALRVATTVHRDEAAA